MDEVPIFLDVASGIGQRMPTGTNKIYFCHFSTIPLDHTVTYARLVSYLQPNKEKEHRVRVTIGGNSLDYLGLTATDTASLTTLGLLLNSAIYTLNSRFMTMDIKNYYYGTPMARYEYMHIPMDLIPDEVIKQYNLQKLSVNGWAYMEIFKGMPGIKQAGKLANERLKKHLGK